MKGLVRCTAGLTVLVIALVALSGALGACSAEPEPGRHVVLILLDAARPDRLGSYGASRPTPNLDALAARGTVFLNHFSQAADTRSSLPRLLYSRYFIPPLFPLSAKVPFSQPSDLFRERDSEAVSLPAVLAANGFHTAMISAHTWLKPETAFAREFAEIYDLSSELPLEDDFPHPRAEAVIDFTLDWLEANRQRDVFLYLHLMDTHSPRFFDQDAEELLYFPKPEQRRHWAGTRDRDLRGREPFGHTERQVLDAIYDGSLRYTDRHLGRLFDLYRDWGALERTLIAVTADHGEILLERPGVLGHGGPWYDLVARVPLIISYPERLESRRIDAESEAVDVVPTMLGALGLEPPDGGGFDGEDLLGGSTERSTRPAFGQRAVRFDGFKVIFEQPDELLLARETPDPALLTGEVYDLAADPGETTNLWSRRADVVAAGLATYRDHLARPYARYRRTRTERQPDSSFAIAARHFRTDRPVPTVGNRRPASKSDWVLSDHWRDSYLMAMPGAPPLTIEFELPNGVYEMSGAISGGGRLVLVDSPPRPFGGAGDGGAVALGEIEIRNQLFRAELAPDRDGSPFSISYLGFRPAGAASDDAERDERLRSLGYVN